MALVFYGKETLNKQQTIHKWIILLLENYMYNAKYEEVDQGEGNGSGGAQIPIVNKMGRVGLTEKMTSEQRLEGGNWRHGSR